MARIIGAGPFVACRHSSKSPLRAALAAGVALLLVASFAGTADAQSRRVKTAVKSQSKKDVPIKQPFGEDMPKGPLQLVVSIAEQRVTLYANGKRIAQAPVSTGTPGHPTPFGIFSVIQKNRWHRSNLYGNAPMWYMHRLTWSGIALHEGVLPGRPASHGCIRLPQDFVSRLWNVSKLGVRVVVAPRDVTYEEFSHAKLFNPKDKPADPGPTASRPPVGLRSSIDTLPLRTQGQAQPIRVAQAAEAVTDNVTTSDATAPQTELPAASPAVAVETAPTPAVTTDDTTVTATAAPVKPAPTLEAEPDKPVDLAAEPAATPAAKNVAAEPAPSPAAVNDATATGTIAAPVETSATTLTPARVAESDQAEPVRPAIDPAELQLPRPAPLRTRSAEPSRVTGQVAVFVSRKEKKIFVRHGFIPIFDMPVEIADADRPLGTHLYTAMELRDNGTKMRWNVLTMPFSSSQSTPASKAGSKAKAPPNKKNAKEAPKPASKVEVRMSNATEALERITIPQEAIDRISEILIPGSSLIISDEGLGRETGRYTEFIVVTR